MIIKGKLLNEKQKREVLNAFIYRCTLDNHHPARIKSAEPIQTDEEWLTDHAFHFVKDGSRLSFNRKWAEPHYLADE